MADSSPGVLFDVDGTLVDSNYLHTVAWWRAFQEAGEDIAMSAIHRLIGMGSDQLVKAVLGAESEELSDAHSRHFAPLRQEIRSFPRAADLLREVRRRGGKVVLATSAKADDLDALRNAIDADDAIDALTSSVDVDSSKPSPDIFTTALEKSGLDARNAIVLGDTVWDIEAARRSGLECVCVCTGGISRQELEEAGAAAVYADVAELLDRLDETPLGAILGG